MLILLSPAKTLDMESPSRVKQTTQPQFTEQTDKLVVTLKRYSKSKLGDLMNISESLAELNRHRYQNWQPEFTDDNARPAIQAFRGDVYVGLDADSLSKRDLNFAQAHVRILSGLYGILKPYDLIQPYRLEMGTALKTRSGKNLYEFWGDRLTDYLNQELAESKQQLVVNLASNEYFKSVKANKLEGELISPIFKDEKNGKYKVISFFAKKARGAMARHLVQTRAMTRDELLAFSQLGYRYEPGESSENKPVFLRSELAAKPYLA